MSLWEWFSGRPWYFQAFMSWVGVMTLYAMVRSCVMVHRYGILNWLRSTFRIEPETWTMIAVLLLILVAVLSAFVLPNGLPF